MHLFAGFMQEETHEQEHHAKMGKRLELLLFLGLAVLALVANVYFRAPMLKFYGFYEPDGYFHYAVIRAAVSNNFVVPEYLQLSGHPVHQPLSEPKGFYYMTIVPYYFLRFFGISYYAIERHIALVFGVLDAIGAYFLSRYLSKDKLFGVLVLFFVGLSMGNAARTSAIIYRGDTFVTIFLIIALILLIELFKSKSRNRKLLLMALAGLDLCMASFVWNGASFAIATVVFAFTLLLLFGFVFERKELAGSCKYVLGSLLIWFALVRILIYAYLVTEQTFTGIYFFVLFFAMLLGWYIAETLLSNKHKLPSLLSTPLERFAVSVGFAVAVVVVIYFLIPNFVYQIFIGNGFEITSSFASTIQELQPPSLSFLTASFGAQNWITPLGWLIVASTYVSSAKYLFWILLLLASMLYLFMQVYESGGFASGTARIRFDFDAPMLIMLSFFAVTAYLEIHAIRFNSLLSVPIAIISAFTVYWAILYCKEKKAVLYAASAITLVFSAYFLYVAYGFTIPILGWNANGALVSLVVIGASLLFAYYQLPLRKQEGRRLYYIAAIVLVEALLLYMAIRDVSYTSNLYPADSINPQLISALAWLKNNSASNSVVLTLWPDGSVVEGVANLTSVSDSVGKQNAAIANPFAAWLYNSSPDPQFLFGNASDKPDYLLTRSIWLNEGSGIFTESGINTSAISNFGFLSFSSVNASSSGGTLTYNFYGNGVVVRTIIKNANGTRSVGSFVLNGQQISPFMYVAFYDQNNGNFSLIKQTAFNSTNNQTFLIQYSDVPSPNSPVNITAAYAFNPGLADSNMAKFLYFCGAQNCIWNNNVASMQLVYANTDTKIFKISYNSTAGPV